MCGWIETENFIASASSLEEGAANIRKRWRQVNVEADAGPDRERESAASIKATESVRSILCFLCLH